MKVTNLETSQRLEELGFEADTMAFIDPDNEECQIWLNAPEGFIPAYDLETILDALPDSIIVNNEAYRLTVQMPFFVGYYKLGKKQENEIRKDIFNESLATTVGRLLVKLLEDNIIKLGE